MKNPKKCNSPHWKFLPRITAFLVKWFVLHALSRILSLNYLVSGFVILLSEMNNLQRVCRRAIYKLDTTITDKIQITIREATSTDPWGPTAADMAEIAEAAATKTPLILAEIWFRLDEDNWKHVYKGLVVLDYLIKHGPENVAKQCWQNVDRLRELRSFPFVDAESNPSRRIREKAGQILGLISDGGKLALERDKARRIRERVSYKDRQFQEFFNGVAPDLSLSGSPVARTVCEPANGDASSPVLRPRNEQEEALHLQLALAASKKDAELHPPESVNSPSNSAVGSDLIDLSIISSGVDTCDQTITLHNSESRESSGGSKRRLIIPPAKFFCHSLLSEEGFGDLVNRTVVENTDQADVLEANDLAGLETWLNSR